MSAVVEHACTNVFFIDLEGVIIGSMDIARTAVVAVDLDSSCLQENHEVSTYKTAVPQVCSKYFMNHLWWEVPKINTMN